MVHEKFVNQLGRLMYVISTTISLWQWEYCTCPEFWDHKLFLT